MFNNNLVLENIEVDIGNHLPQLDNFKILHFSDLHLRSLNQQFDNFFTQLSKIDSDLVIISGDLIDADTGINACVKYLSGLTPRYGTFVVFGNHDRYCVGLKELILLRLIKELKLNNLNLLRNALQNNGINVLTNAIARLDINGLGLELIGLECPIGYDRIYDGKKFRSQIVKLQELIDQADARNYVILISHVPDLIQELDISKIKIILSSHTHGGQIRFPFIGPLIALSSFQRKYSVGFFKYNGTYFHVSSGLGTTDTTPIRFRCPPRASVLTLKNNTSSYD